MKQTYTTLLTAALLFAGAAFAQQQDHPRAVSPAPATQATLLQTGDDGHTHLYKPADGNNTQTSGCASLLTTTAMGNGNAGIMFDVVAIADLRITFFDAVINGGTGWMHIYSRAGTHVGHEMTPADWTLIDSVQMTLGVQDTLYHVPIYVNYPVAAGDTAAFYISGDGTNLSVDYTNGSVVGDTCAQDLSMKVLEGTGMSWPWAGTYTPRVFNGIVNYCLSGYDPCLNTTTTYAGGNGFDGNMFDITSDFDITVNGFSGNFNGSGYVKIYTHLGTYVGTETNAPVWNLVDSVMLTSSGANVPSSIPMTVSLPIPAGQTRAFYITGTGTGADVNYTNGTAVGNVFTYDGIISVKEGMGMAYPFVSGATPRVWNGTVSYCAGITGTQELQAANAQLSVYPNPAGATATLTISTQQPLTNGTVVIRDVAGRVVQELHNVGNTATINTGALNGGVYFYSVYSNDGQSLGTGKFIVE